MDLSVQEFYDRATFLIKDRFPQCQVEVAEKNSLRLKVRIKITLRMFIDIFYAARTKKASIAVILKGERVFGIDNLGGWHVHPVGQTKEHHMIEEPTPEQALEQCAAVARTLEMKQESAWESSEKTPQSPP